MKQILIADDHEIIRSGLRKFIETLIPHCVIEEANDGDSTFKKIKEHEDIYDLIILDVNMPDTDSFGLVSNIMAIKPESKILIFSMGAEEIYAKKYFQLGAKGYVSKSSPNQEIGNAISNTLNNKAYISEKLRDLYAEEMMGKRNSNPFDNLSSREFEIVQHLIRGESVGEISKVFNLHTSTTGTHKARILKKLNCKNIIDINTLATVHKIAIRC
jgi:two-component system, NarL family, invasion response regulator UvrY